MGIHRGKQKEKKNHNVSRSRESPSRSVQRRRNGNHYHHHGFGIARSTFLGILEQSPSPDIGGSSRERQVHLLFWLSLTPSITAWMGQTHFA